MDEHKLTTKPRNDAVVVVDDSGNGDGDTLYTSKEAGCTVIHHPWENAVVEKRRRQPDEDRILQVSVARRVF